MKLTADTNVLIRAFTEDEPEQSRLAQDHLRKADLVAVPLPALCELAWVLRRGYKVPTDEIATLLRRLLDSANVVTNRPAAEAGLAILEAGGDFADGAIAFDGSWLGAQIFLTFDRRAAKLLRESGYGVELLS